VLLIGSSWSMLVIITFYTAQVAATVIFPSRSIAQVASFHQALSMDLRICGLSAMQQSIEAHSRAMRLNGLYVPVSDYRDILTSMDSGQCDVGIFTGHAYISYVLPDANYCATFVLLDATIESLSVALPVSDAVRGPLSWLTMNAAEKGDWSRSLTQAIQDFVPPARCDQSINMGAMSGRRLAAVGEMPSEGVHFGRLLANRASGPVSGSVASNSGVQGAENTFEQLDLTGAAGPLFMAWFAASLALLINLAGRVAHMVLSYKRQQTKTIPHKKELEPSALPSEPGLHLGMEQRLERLERSIAQLSDGTFSQKKTARRRVRVSRGLVADPCLHQHTKSIDGSHLHDVAQDIPANLRSRCILRRLHIDSRGTVSAPPEHDGLGTLSFASSSQRDLATAGCSRTSGGGGGVLKRPA